MSDPMEIIQQHINLLGELPASHTKFRTDLNEKIKRIQLESDKLKDLLENISELKTKMARSSRDINTVRDGYKKEINDLNEEAKKNKDANTNKLRGIAENLSKHTATLNGIKGATDGINLDELEKNVKALQEALNAEVRLPEQKSVKTSTDSPAGWGSVAKNVSGSIAGTTGAPITNIGNLPNGWSAAKNLQQGHKSHGKLYYYKDADPEGSTTYNFADTWNKYTTDDGTEAYQHPDTEETSYDPQPEMVASPTSGGRRKSKRNVNMRRKGGRRTRRRKGGFRYDMSPQEEKRSRTLRSVKSLRSKSTKKSNLKSKRKTRNVGKRRRRTKKRNKGKKRRRR